MKAFETLTNDALAKAGDDVETAYCLLMAIKRYVHKSVCLADELNDIDRKAGR